MKNMIKLPALLLGLMLLMIGMPQTTMAQDDGDISLETFYQELAPYGKWTQDPDYGYVWHPNVEQGFRPYYTDGHWAMTEYGNTWVSDYEWGWAPFHYGRWLTNRFNEWTWIPDTVWGPAWVTWRSGGGYYGWAPMGPGLDVGSNADDGFDTPNDWWVFIPQTSIYNDNYPQYYNRNQNIFGMTTYLNFSFGSGRNHYYTGPRADDIRRVTRRDVRVYHVNPSNRPGRTVISNNNINIYNPGSGRRGNYNGSTQPGRNNNPGIGQNGQPGRNNPGRGNNQNPGVQGSNGNPAIGVQHGNVNPGNVQNGQPGRNYPGRGNNQNPGQPAGNANPSRGNNQNPGQPVGTYTPVTGQPTGNTNPGNGQNAQPGRNNGRRGGYNGQQSDVQQQMQQQQRDGQQRQQQDQQRQQMQQQRQQQMQQRDGQQNQLQQQQRQQQMQQQQQQQNQQRQQQQQQARPQPAADPARTENGRRAN